MKFNKENASDIKIAYIGGGSRGWAISFIKDLACEQSLSGTIKLYDIDKESALENETIGNNITENKDSKGKWIYKAVDTLEEALKGTDFIVISILPGTFKEMAVDVHAPEKYGIYQAVGDTTGPGGINRALRTIPIYVEFAEKIKKYSPSAWVINYTNPMAVCTRILYKIFPEIKVFGCCHEVFSTQELLRAMLKDMKNIDVAHREEIKVNVLGINHFTWLDNASYKHINLMPLYHEFVDKYYKDGFINPYEDQSLNEVFKSSNRVKFDLFKRYGLIASAGDRHLTEFLPSSWYLKDKETVKHWKFLLTSVDVRIKMREELNEYRKRIISGKEKIVLKSSGEEGVRIIKALIGLGNLITNVNFPNYGQIKGLPYGAVVESNALFSRDNIQPLYSGELPIELQNIVTRHSLNHELIINAALKKDKELVAKCMLNDPLINLEPNKVDDLVNEMLDGTKKYLDGWNLN